MLKGISPIISPELLKILCEMGHGDEIVIADANFPSVTYGKRVIRADGMSIKKLWRIMKMKMLRLKSWNAMIFTIEHRKLSL